MAGRFSRDNFSVATATGKEKILNQDFIWLQPGTRVAATGQQFACGECNPKGQPRSKFIPDTEPIAIHAQKRYPLCQEHALARGASPYFAEGGNKNAPANNAGAIPTAMRSDAIITDPELVACVKEMLLTFKAFMRAQGIDPDLAGYEEFLNKLKVKSTATHLLIKTACSKVEWSDGRVVFHAKPILAKSVESKRDLIQEILGDRELIINGGASDGN